MILVVSYPEDDHTQEVVRRLRDAGHHTELLDMSMLPHRAGVELDYSRSGSPRFALRCPDGTECDLTDCRAGWWRRLRGFTLDPQLTDPSAQAFAASETDEAVTGMIASLPCRWINDPERDRAAHHKPWQWTVAGRVGLDLPRTRVTMDPARARDFVDELGPGNVVTKAFLARADAWRETRVLHRRDLDHLEAVRFAPTILQEYIPGVDLRVTVVGRQLFATEIDATATSYPADMRMVLGEASIRPTILPGQVADRIRALMDALGLIYGAVDLRRTADGRYVFFEVNPAGLWLFAEEASGWPITDALAAELAARDQQLPAAA